GVFNAEDESYDKLQLWQDHNQNGISEQGELISLAEAGVASINLNATAIAESNNENHIGLRSSWADTDGNQHDIDDVWFNTLDSDSGISESDLLSDDSHEIEGLGDQAEYAQGASSNEAPLASAEFIQADDLLLEQLSNNGSNVCYF
ncbi:MAG: hypothetical protein OIF51_08695, partial [Cellvibrionaceae bacterium]|nr:hypothetical protein [Cellvibrionaceae bacterium]